MLLLLKLVGWVERSVTHQVGINMKIGNRVKLKTFNGTLISDDDCSPHEDHWKLIGQIGCIVQNSSEKNRLLVQFEEDVNSFELECHNVIKNSLWILESDLTEIICDH